MDGEKSSDEIDFFLKRYAENGKILVEALRDNEKRDADADLWLFFKCLMLIVLGGMTIYLTAIFFYG